MLDYNTSGQTAQNDYVTVYCMQQPFNEDNDWDAYDSCDTDTGCTSLEAMPGAQHQWLCEDCLNCEDF